MKITPRDRIPITPIRRPGPMSMPPRYILCATPGLKWYWRQTDAAGVTIAKGPWLPKAAHAVKDAWDHARKAAPHDYHPTFYDWMDVQ